jgi:tetratricopeptide (TPR) repeat protein
VHQWIRTREILEEALERDPRRRPEFVAEACAGDLELQREVEEYLRYQEAAEQNPLLRGWIRNELDPEPTEAERDPERFGVYRILRRLGEGGMGVVYLAERDDDEYRQQVALKALKPGPQSAHLLHLFRRERQILAQLQHPNIALLMDGGTVNGEVFYVMEYVEGSPVTAYCDERQLTVRQRLQLFRSICEAVGYAHRKLIIHRDLKPGNILVTREGIPKLLDFGLAKAFQESAAGEPATISIGPMLTPAYASPEQVRGEPLSTSADVYSLGVLLYELLTGHNPQARPDQSPLEVCRTILDEDPPLPSHALEPGVQRVLGGRWDSDLDNIVLMALRKEPERRYGSVDELRVDLERYLGGFPVRASRGTAAYRLRKYLGRHRWGLAVSSLGAAAALAAAMTIWWEGHQAEMRFDDVRGLAHSVIFELHDAIADLQGSTAAKKLIVERALEYLRKLQASGVRKRELQLEIAAAYRKIGEAQGAWSRSNLGDTRGAARSYGEARRILQELLRSGETPDVLEALSGVDEELANVVLRLGDIDRQHQLWQEATEIRQKLARNNPHSPEAPARALWDVAEGSYWAHNWNAAQPAFRKALAAYQALAAQEPQNGPYAQQVISCRFQLSYVERQLKEWKSALDDIGPVRVWDEARARAMPDDRNAQMRLATDWNGIGVDLAGLGNFKAALPAYQQAAAIADRVSRADPQDSTAAVLAACWLADVAHTFDRTGKTTQAVALYREASERFEAQLRHDPADTQGRGLYAYFVAQWGDLEARKKTRAGWQAAVALYQHAEELFAPLKPVLDMDEDDMATKADLPRRLAECRRHLAPTRQNADAPGR